MRVASTVDYEREGKQLGYLHVPHSSDRSAWGTVLVPVFCIRGGPGPTVLLTGGNHGDEYEGQVVLTRLGQELDAERVQGRLIVLPALNLPAALAGTRVSPLDGGNMNRAFPGDPGGGVTAMIAHYVDSVLLPMADAVLDLHSGGASLEFVPSAIVHRLPDADRMRRTLDALEAFGAPVGLVLEELDAHGMLDTAAETKGKLFLSTELGGGATLSPRTVRVGDAGVKNVLAHLGVLPDHTPPEPPASRLMEVPDGSYFVKADAAGLYEPFHDLGDEVAEGEPLGRVVAVEEPERPPRTVIAGRSGLLFARAFRARVERGDCLAVLGRDLDRGSLPG